VECYVRIIFAELDDCQNEGTKGAVVDRHVCDARWCRGEVEGMEWDVEGGLKNGLFDAIKTELLGGHVVGEDGVKTGVFDGELTGLDVEGGGVDVVLDDGRDVVDFGDGGIESGHADDEGVAGGLDAKLVVGRVRREKLADAARHEPKRIEVGCVHESG
jgi:hypothetical protein